MRISIKTNFISYGDLWIFFNANKEIISTKMSTKPSIIQKYSELIISDQIIIKKIRYQKTYDHIRKLYRSQAKREVYSSKILDKIGLNIPKTYGYGINISPAGKYESIIIMEYIKNSGTLRDFFVDSHNPIDRKIFLKLLTEDLKKMMQNGIYHKDAHFNNILISENRKIFWIDNDISKIKNFSHIKRLLRKFIFPSYITDCEKSFICSQLNVNLDDLKQSL